MVSYSYITMLALNMNSTNHALNNCLFEKSIMPFGISNAPNRVKAAYSVTVNIFRKNLFSF